MTTTYTDLGPIPEDGMPDLPPLRITNIAELAVRNGLNEAVFIVDAMGTGPIKLILGCNPHTCEVTRAAVLLRPGTGFVATDPAALPGNLLDIIHSILREQREEA